MYRGATVIDVHGHMSTPPHFRAYAMNLIALRTPGEGDLVLTEDQQNSALGRHLKMMDERNIDVQLISPRPVAMMHWERPFLVNQWTRVTNDIIAHQTRMYPKRFVGVAQLPQSADLDTSNCVDELTRCVEELGFVGATLNPDPGADRRAPGVNDPYWYPLYKRAQELKATLVVHPSISRDPRFEPIPHSYQMNNIAEETLAVMLYKNTDVFDRFPDLKVVVCHCGGALDRFIPPTGGFSGDSGGGQTGFTTSAGRSADIGAHHQELQDNLFYDSCAYDEAFLTAAIQQRGVSQMVFGTEAPGSGTAYVNPDTGRPSDDILPILDRIRFLTDADRVAIVNANPRRVFPLLSV